MQPKQFSVKNQGFTVTCLPKGPPPAVLFAVQHNGRYPYPFEGLLAPRTTGEHAQEGRTLELAKSVFRRSLPHAGIAWQTLPRKFLDTNVEPGPEAFADPDAEEAHETFHHAVESVLWDAVQHHGPARVLLVDLHVCAAQPPYAPPGGYDVILGTANRETVRGGADRELADAMERRGLRVFLPGEEPVASRPDWFDGGYLIRRHFESQPKLAGAIQIEVHENLSRAAAEITPEGHRRRTCLEEALLETVLSLGQTVAA